MAQKKPAADFFQKLLGRSVGCGIPVGLLYLLANNKMTKQNVAILILAAAALGKMIGGHQHHLFYTLFGKKRNKILMQGQVKPGYEKVRDEFEKNFVKGMERCSQVALFVKGECVVNLFGAVNDDNYSLKSIQNVYSSSKVVTSIAIAMLVDQGHLDYKEKVSKYWPEFAKNGKENITIEQVMKHECGLPVMKPSVLMDQIQRENLKKNSLGEQIANMKPNWHKKTDRSYHLISIGYILNEIVRRVDPQGRTIGEFVEQEIAQPLNSDFYFGVPKHRIPSVSKHTSVMHDNKLWFYLQGLVPKCLGRKIAINTFFVFMFDIGFFIRKHYNKVFDFNHPKVVSGEAPGANGNGSAFALAQIGNIMALKGTVGEKQFMSEETWRDSLSEASQKPDSTLFNIKTKFTKGGWNVFDKDSQLGTKYDKYGFIGWQGVGGSVMQWHVEKQISFGYVGNNMDGDLSNQIGYRLRKVAYDCTQELEKKQEQS